MCICRHINMDNMYAIFCERVHLSRILYICQRIFTNAIFVFRFSRIYLAQHWLILNGFQWARNCTTTETNDTMLTSVNYIETTLKIRKNVSKIRIFRRHSHNLVDWKKKSKIYESIWILIKKCKGTPIFFFFFKESTYISLLLSVDDTTN